MRLLSRLAVWLSIVAALDFGTYAFDRTTELYDAYPDKTFVIPE